MRNITLEESVLKATTNVSYRKTGEILNDVVPGFDVAALKASTLCEHVEKEGILLDQAISDGADAILRGIFRKCKVMNLRRKSSKRESVVHKNRKISTMPSVPGPRHTDKS